MVDYSLIKSCKLCFCVCGDIQTCMLAPAILPALYSPIQQPGYHFNSRYADFSGHFFFSSFCTFLFTAFFGQPCQLFLIAASVAPCPPCLRECKQSRELFIIYVSRLLDKSFIVGREIPLHVNSALLRRYPSPFYTVIFLFFRNGEAE